LTFWLEPEVDGVLLPGFVLVVEDRIGEPAIACHTAHALDLLEDEVEVGIDLEENVGALDIRLTADELAEIDSLIPPAAAAGSRYSEPGMRSINL
jgi:hypothetical protein